MDQRRKVRCPCRFCKDGKLECATCGGKRVVFLAFYFMPAYHQRCPTCDGRGFTTCDYCDGNGYIEIPIEEE